MTILDIENLIVERLKAKVENNLVVEGFPERPAEYVLIHPVGALLVRYFQSKFTEPKTVDIISQERIVTFAITLKLRGLRDGAYTYLDLVRDTLTGWRFEGFSKMYPVDEGYVGESNGIWEYEMLFSMITVHTEIERERTKIETNPDGSYADDAFYPG